MQVDDAEGGFTVEMPSNRQARLDAVPAGRERPAHRLDRQIGTDTSLAVYYAPLSPVDGETAKGTVNRMVDDGHRPDRRP